MERVNNFLRSHAVKLPDAVLVNVQNSFLSTSSSSSIKISSNLLEAHKCVIHHLAKHSSANIVESYMSDMNESRIRPDLSCYTHAIRAYISKNDSKNENVQHLWNIVERKFWPGLKTYSSIIDSYARIGHIVECEKWFGELCKRGLSPDVLTYNSLIHSCVKHCNNSSFNAEKAENWFNKISEQALTPDVGSYRNVIEANTSRKDVDRALFWLNKMESECVIADNNNTVQCYNLILNVLADKGEVDQVFVMLEKMCASKHVQPTLYSFNICLHALSKRDNALQKIDFVLDLMRTNNVCPDNISYNSILDICAKADDVTKSLQYFQQMKNANLQPDIVSYHSIIDAFARRGDISSVKNMLTTLKNTQSLGVCERTYLLALQVFTFRITSLPE